jgi:hypothetical protein
MGDAGQRAVADPGPAEFRGGGLAEHDRTRILQPGDHRRVHRRAKPLRRLAAGMGGKVLGPGQVLDGDRQPVQRPDRTAAHQRRLGLPRLVHRTIRAEAGERVDPRLQPFDPAQDAADHLDR